MNNGAAGGNLDEGGDPLFLGYCNKNVMVIFLGWNTKNLSYCQSSNP